MPRRSERDCLHFYGVLCFGVCLTYMGPVLAQGLWPAGVSAATSNQIHVRWLLQQSQCYSNAGQARLAGPWVLAKRPRLALLFKVIKGHVAVMAQTLDLTKADSCTWANHPHKLRTPRARTKSLQSFITHRSISDWNALRSHVVAATTTDSFKARLAGLASGAPTMAAL